MEGESEGGARVGALVKVSASLAPAPVRAGRMNSADLQKDRTGQEPQYIE